ncbi:mechanosensitive ion channel family protein [Lysobacter korlensis]|uniref:Small-conductance mechanosensitive channel n=1 Tax=Lysobacter korlensis TaxID=553636 RepID=A0ABV6RQT1_9GAMM
MKSWEAVNSAGAGLAGVEPDVGNAWDTVDAMVDGFFALLPNIAIAAVVFLVFWIVAKVIQKVVARATANRENGNLATVLSRLGYWVLLILGLLVAITIIVPSMTPGKLVSTLGIGGVAIAFAFKDIFQNLLAGILILLQKPFRVGDEITSGAFTGTVEAIETRATWIKTYDGIRVIVPNSQIYQEPVSVITAYGMVRSEYDVGIGYGDDIGQALEVALDTLKGIDGILDDPAPDVLVWELAGSTVNLRMRWWTNPKRANVVVKHSEVLRKVAEAMGAAGIDLPFPTRVVLLHDQTEATDGDRTKQREGWPAGDSPPPARTVAGALIQAAEQAPAQQGDKPAT